MLSVSFNMEGRGVPKVPLEVERLIESSPGEEPTTFHYLYFFMTSASQAELSSI